MEQAKKEQATNPYNMPAGAAAPQNDATAAPAASNEAPAAPVEAPAEGNAQN
jgi:preprotein translocase subunit SecG